MAIPHINIIANNAAEIRDASGVLYLQSYNTVVGFIDLHGQPHRLWSGSSRTTCRHWAEFLRRNGVRPVPFGDLEIEEAR